MITGLHVNIRFYSRIKVVNLLWPALIYLFPEARNLFFVFFVFVLAATTYRWGLPETVGTAVGSLILLSLESVLRQGLLSRLNGFFLRYHWPQLGVDASDLELKKLLIPSVRLLLMGCLLGNLAEQHKVLRAELERASLARELHHRLQLLIGLQMRLHVLADSQKGSIAQELREIEHLLLEGVRKVRELIQPLKLVDVDANSLYPHLIEVTQKVGRETGIRIQFISDSSVVDIESSFCGIVVRIVQEALANIRKHSCATDVCVHLARKGSNWQPSIQDNGIGFQYSGHFSQSELAASGRAR